MSKSATKVVLLAVLCALVWPAHADDCRGYRGPGGACYAGPGGGLYAGPGGGLYTGPGGGLYAGRGGGLYAGLGGGMYAGPGGGLYTGPGGGLYAGPGGGIYAGPPSDDGYKGAMGALHYGGQRPRMVMPKLSSMNARVSPFHERPNQSINTDGSDKAACAGYVRP